MKKIIKRVAALTPLLMLTFFTIPFAQAHFLGYSAVDNGEIRWGGSTAYSTQWNAAIATWMPLGGINIAPDTYYTLEDLTISDINAGASGWVGMYTNSIGADTIQFNTYYFAGSSNDLRQHTATHELGHALGLAHSYSGNIMHGPQSSQIGLGSHDIEDYNTLHN